MLAYLAAVLPEVGTVEWRPRPAARCYD